ncbi:MAG: 16S rRNA (cytidine(1402)-2'-O)-methyltransferase [Candidatus Kapaibacterium sp.]
MPEAGRIEAALYLVPTPIGNMQDITLRAIEILKSADIIACEDTRRTGMLLKNLGIIPKKLDSYHEHNEQKKAPELASLISEGISIALVSDAGYPLISDPGYRLVNAVTESGGKIIPLPGATAAIPALAASGMASHSFTFMGFPPQKKGRTTFLIKCLDKEETIILYESPYRIERLINEIIEYSSPDRKVCLGREISKLHEEFIRGSAEECLKVLKGKAGIKGEFVIIIEGNKG